MGWLKRRANSPVSKGFVAFHARLFNLRFLGYDYEGRASYNTG